MTIMLEAFVPEDGRAIVRDGFQHWLLHPPYRATDMRGMTGDEAWRAFAEEAVFPAAVEFRSWNELVRHLVAEREQALGLEVLCRRVLAHAEALVGGPHRAADAIEAGRRRG